MKVEMEITHHIGSFFSGGLQSGEFCGCFFFFFFLHGSHRGQCFWVSIVSLGDLMVVICELSGRISLFLGLVVVVCVDWWCG